MRSPLRIAVCLAAFLPARAVLAGTGTDDGGDRGGTVKVNVVVDMTEAGKKISRPTPDQPVYYRPMPSGYEEIGTEVMYRRPPPPAAEVEKLLEREFAGEGYRVAVQGSRPSLVLEFAWGCMAPWSIHQPGGGNVPPDWIRTLLFGDTLDTIGFDGKPTDIRTVDDLREMIEDHRAFYYVIVSAFDFEDLLHRKATLLWRARISTMIWGHYFDQVLPTMIATAAPLLGRETFRPQLAAEPIVPLGQVIVGAPVLKSAKSASAPSQTTQ